MKKIGFYGGTFDPIHFGHISMAIQLAESEKLDEVWVCPAFCSPFKKDQKPIASPKHRLEMVRLAVGNIPGFKVISSEIDLKKISYTIDTIRSLPKAEYRLLLSEETAAGFRKWKEADELARLAPPLIGCRSTPDLFRHQEDPWRSDPVLKKGIILTKVLEISSTEIRERIKNKLYCGHLVPAKALDYIESHQLYFP